MRVPSQFQVQGFLSQTLLDVDSFPNLLASSGWRYWSATARWRGASQAQTHMATARHRRVDNMFGSNGELNASTGAEGDNGCASAQRPLADARAYRRTRIRRWRGCDLTGVAMVQRTKDVHGSAEAVGTPIDTFGP